MSIGADVLRIRDVLSPSTDLRVPPYQRGFAWTDKETGALMKDLLEAFAQSEIYFLGAMVAIQQKGRSFQDVVDGQQRLTTLTILLAVLRDLTSASDEAAALHSMIGHEAIRWGDRHRWRVTLNTQDATFFREWVQARNATRRVDQMDEAAEASTSESHGSLAEAVRLIRDELTDMSDDERHRFGRWLADEVFIVRVRVTEQSLGYKVFLVLNQRGKRLSDHDVLKSALFERAGFTANEAIAHSKRWNAYATQLGATDFEGMLKQIRFLYDRGMRGEFISGLLHAILLRMPVSTFINDLLPRFVDAYDTVVNGKTERVNPGPDALRSIAFLRLINHEGWQAPAIKYLVDAPHDRDGSARFFAALERLAFWLQYCVKDREYRAKRYRRVLEAMESPGGPLEQPTPLDLSNDEKSALKLRLAGRFTNLKQRKSMLMRLSGAVPGGTPIDPEADATVEHILPRTPSKGSEWYEEWSRARDIEDLTECIGNFTLLTHAENQLADRKRFAEKLAIYFKKGGASFALSGDLKGRAKWTPEDVRTRRDMLIGCLAREWDL